MSTTDAPPDGHLARHAVADAARKYVRLDLEHEEAKARIAPLRAARDEARTELRDALKELPNRQAVVGNHLCRLAGNGQLVIEEIEVLE